MANAPKGKNISDPMKFLPLKADTYPFVQGSNLKGRNVLITGASKGIGKATALSYAAAGAAAIVVTARSDMTSHEDAIVAKAKEHGHAAPVFMPLQMDVTSKESTAAAAKAVKQRLGHIDIIIINAGALEPRLPLLDSDPDLWWRTWETNIRGPYLTMFEFMPLVLASPNPDKTVIGVSSGGAHYLTPGASGYQTTKLALLRLMEFVGVDYSEKGVLAYSIGPGAVATDLAMGNLPERFHHLLTDTPELAADTMVWLTEERREWLAGRYVDCRWDMEGLLGRKEEIVEKDLLKVRMAVGWD